MADVLPLRIPGVDTDPAAGPVAAPVPLAVDAKGLTALLPVGLRTVRTWDAAGKLPRPVRIGGRVVWLVSEIRAWLDAGAPPRDVWERTRAARK